MEFKPGISGKSSDLVIVDDIAETNSVLEKMLSEQRKTNELLIMLIEALDDGDDERVSGYEYLG